MKLSALALPLSLILLAAGSAAAEPTGKELHQEHCTACHERITGGNGSSLYTRSDRRVNDLEELKQQVTRCKNNLQITLFDDDLEAIVGYLNERYYRFEE